MSKDYKEMVVLLNDGTVLRATTAQVEKINQLILSTHEFEKIEIKLDGRIFKLGELETDREKIALVKQSQFDLGDTSAQRKIDLG